MALTRLNSQALSQVNTGSILQVVKTTQTTAVATTNFRSYIEIDNLTLTTKGTNSSFLVMGTAHAYASNITSRAAIGFQIGSTFIAGKDGSSGDSWGHNVGGQGGWINRHFITDQTYATGTSLTFRLMGAMWDDNKVQPANVVHDPMYFTWGSNVSVDYGNHAVLTVMEIAG